MTPFIHNEVPDKREIVIISVPYSDPIPMVAPALLAGCLTASGINAKAIDFNFEFFKKFSSHHEFSKLKSFLTMGGSISPKFSKSLYKDLLKFTIKFLKKIKQYHDPKYIGISIFTSESLDFGLILSYLIRKYLPDVAIIAGGKGLEVHGNSSEYLYEIWHKHNIADLIVVGDAEISVIDAIRGNHTGVFFSGQQSKEELDAIPLPQWEDYDMKGYARFATAQTTGFNKNKDHGSDVPYLTVTASKGCVRKCSFCDVASFWPNYLYRDPTKVAEEIIYNYKKTGIWKFRFTDNLINGSVSNFRKMNEILSQEIPNEISYDGYAIFRSAHAMPEKDFKLAALAGNTAWSVGVESGSEKIRDDMKKKFSDDDLEWSVRMLYKYGIKQTWLLIVGYPSETEEDFIKTKNMIAKFSPLVEEDNITIQVTLPFMLLRNSPLVSNPLLAKKHGLEHVIQEPDNFKVNNFWTSTVYPENDFPTRSRRWKELIQLIKDSGYQFGSGMPVDKWTEELAYLDKAYKENYEKTTFSLYTSK